MSYSEILEIIVSEEQNREIYTEKDCCYILLIDLAHSLIANNISLKEFDVTGGLKKFSQGMESQQGSKEKVTKFFQETGLCPGSFFRTRSLETNYKRGRNRLLTLGHIEWKATIDGPSNQISLTPNVFVSEISFHPVDNDGTGFNYRKFGEINNQDDWGKYRGLYNALVAMNTKTKIRLKDHPSLISTYFSKIDYVFGVLPIEDKYYLINNRPFLFKDNQFQSFSFKDVPLDEIIKQNYE